MRLQQLKPGAQVRGLAAGAAVVVRGGGGQGHLRGRDGAVRNRLVYRTDETALEVAEAGRAWAFDGDGNSPY